MPWFRPHLTKIIFLSLVTVLNCWPKISSGQTEPLFHQGSLKNYKTSMAQCKNSKEEALFRLREFYTGKKLKPNNFSFVVNTKTLETSIVESETLICDNKVTLPTTENSLYSKILNLSSEKPFPIENDGFTHSQSLGYSTSLLTVDLCPSLKALDRDFFIKLSQKMKPFPVAISISGFWILKHKEDLDWLIEQEKNGSLSITWVNHSNSHPYIRDLPKKNNFLLLPTVNLDNEILRTEIKLIEYNLMPSIFFRFPGLISNEKLVTTLTTKYGLVTLGADAWLTAGAKPNPKGNSIILVHGNGNEPLGLKLFWKYPLAFETILPFVQHSFY